MTLFPGDTIQIILTVGGVPYAKTRQVDNIDFSTGAVRYLLKMMLEELTEDIDLYANETESANEEVSQAG